MKNCRSQIIPKSVFSICKHLLSILCGSIFLLVLTVSPSAAQKSAKPEHEIKLATLAPENSSLMQIFNEMNAEILKETDGKVGFKMYSGFVLGDEEDVLRKLRIGLVHGAAFTSSALTDICPEMRALMIPFLFRSAKEVDYVLEKLDSSFKQTFSKNGYEVLGWPELGFIYFMSTTPIAGLEDLKGKRVWAKSNMPMAQAIIDRADVSTVAIAAPDVLMALQTNLLDVVYNSPYYAVVTQWFTHIKFITDLPLTYIGGALLIDKKVFDKIPAPLQETVRKVSAKHLRRLNEKTRKDNADAFELILKRGVKKVAPTPEQAAGFRQVADSAVSALGPKYLPPETTAKVRAWLDEYRISSARQP